MICERLEVLMDQVVEIDAASEKTSTLFQQMQMLL